MSLRDWFAGQALNKVIESEIERQKAGLGLVPFNIVGVARGCYGIADAMIAEREK
jgi:hypothetical protein